MLVSNKSCIFKSSLLNCVPHVLTCQRVLCAYVPTHPACLRAHELTCLACSRTNVSYMLTCQRALRACVLKFQTTKASFQWHVFLRFGIKLYMKKIRARMSLETFILRIQLNIPAFYLTRRKSLEGAMTNFVK